MILAVDHAPFPTTPLSLSHTLAAVLKAHLLWQPEVAVIARLHQATSLQAHKAKEDKMCCTLSQATVWSCCSCCAILGTGLSAGSCAWQVLNRIVKLHMLQRPRLLSRLLFLFPGHSDAAAQLAGDA